MLCLISLSEICIGHKTFPAVLTEIVQLKRDQENSHCISGSQNGHPVVAGDSDQDIEHEQQDILVAVLLFSPTTPCTAGLLSKVIWTGP